MYWKMRSTVVLLLTILCVVATGSLAATAEAVARATFWVAGSVHDLERAIMERERIVARTGMQVMVVPAQVDGDLHYRLVIKASDKPSNRALQESNLRYFGVREPWLIDLALPVVELAPGQEDEAPDAVAEPVATPVQLAAAAPATETATDAATSAEIVEVQPVEEPRPVRTSGDRMLEVARRSYEERHYGATIDQVSAALAAGVDDVRLYYYRAEAYSRLGQYDKAIIDFDNAIRIDPDFSDAYNRRGFAFQMQGDRERALQDYKRALELDPANSGAMFNRARIFLIQIAPVLLILAL